MNKIALLGTLLLLFVTANAQVEELKKAQQKGRDVLNLSRNKKSKPINVSKSSYVNPFIGTGGHGHTYPGAVAPFGMIQLSPDTRFDGWDGCSGYHYSDSIIYGFSHTHLSGTGVSDYGDLLIVPQNGRPRIDPGYASKKGYGSHFSHSSEKASPGYYEVHLDDSDIDVRLTVSERSGFHEYTFKNEKGKKFILLDLDHRDKLLAHQINVHSKQSISGKRVSSSWAEEQHFYFHLELDTPYQKIRLFEKNGRHKALLVFPKNTQKINLKIGISAVDEVGAKNNLMTEIPNWNFDQVRAHVVKQWNKELGSIYYEPFDRSTLETFYTALYHSYLAPNVFSDVDGRYRGMDKEIHQLPSSNSKQYTVFSLWDTYRATHPLYTLTQVNRTNEFINTFLRQYEQSGDLPVWELAGNETNCMIGYHSVSVIADAYTKGIREYNAKKALEAMLTTSRLNEFGKQQFQNEGYINSGEEPESVSKILEYSYDEFCINQMMNALKKGNSPNRFRRTSEYLNGFGMFGFVNSYDPQTKFMRARQNGYWFSPFKPAEVNFNYTEANSWQYSLYAPHAVGVLRDLLGGPDSLEVWLDKLFTTESHLSGRHQVDITGLIGQYAHGNEPSHHMAYLYNYTNAPEKTQYYVDRILKEMYSNEPDGLSGNEDCGQMSSWYVLNALGIYQIAPANPFYEIGRPLINKGMVRFENGKRLTILVENNAEENKYVQKVILNGLLIDRSYLTHEELVSGGKLRIVMGKSPKKKSPSYVHAPTIEQLPKAFIPLPYFKNEQRVFEDQVEIELDMVTIDSCSIYYTLDGSEPTKSSLKYTGPFTIKETTLIKAIAISQHGRSSIISNQFTKKDQNVSVEILSTYSNQYAAGGDFALIDGIRGGNEYRTGSWQGYWDQNFEAIINFKEARSLKEVGIGVLSDMKSWIFYPENVTFSVSYNGTDWEDLSTIELDAEQEKDMFPPHHIDLSAPINSSEKVQKIKVTVVPTSECPEWSLGAGNPTWLFIDEIFFE